MLVHLLDITIISQEADFMFALILLVVSGTFVSAVPHAVWKEMKRSDKILSIMSFACLGSGLLFVMKEVISFLK